MAQADSILVNDNINLKDTRVVDLFIEPHVFMNALIKNKTYLDSSSTIIDIDPRYDYRPDRLAYDIYGHDFWYPAILIVNNMGSMLQFKTELLNFKCRIPNKSAIASILEQVSKSNELLNNHPIIFKS